MYHFSLLDLSSESSLQQEVILSIWSHLLPSTLYIRLPACWKLHIPSFPTLTTHRLSLQAEGTATLFQSPVASLPELDYRANQDAQSTDYTPSTPHIPTYAHAKTGKCSVSCLWGKVTSTCPKPSPQRPTLYLGLPSSSKKIWKENKRKIMWII